MERIKHRSLHRLRADAPQNVRSKINALIKTQYKEDYVSQASHSPTISGARFPRKEDFNRKPRTRQHIVLNVLTAHLGWRGTLH
jgi:hypothetical protein